MGIRTELNAVWLAGRGRALREVGRLRRLLSLGRSSPDIQLYQRMRRDNAAAEPIYRAGRFWESINRDFEDIIWGGGLADLRNQYFNRRFAGPEPTSRDVYRALLWLYYNRVRELDVDDFLLRHEDAREGGERDHELIHGRRVSLDFLQSVEEAYLIRRAWRDAGRSGSPPVIAELGAGYGRLAYVCRLMMPESSYVILDLPEALMCSSSWLGRVFPGELVPYEGARPPRSLDRTALEAGQIWALGAQQIEAIADGSIDAFVNIYSFAEMPPASVANYLKEIDRLSTGVFVSKQREVEHNVDDAVELDMTAFPVPSHWRQLFVQGVSLYGSFFETAYDVSSPVAAATERLHP